MLANSAALFIGNICAGVGVGTENKAAEKAIVDAVLNALGKEKNGMNLYEATRLLEESGYILENISLICEGIKTDGLKEEIVEKMKTKAKIGISSIDSEESRVFAFVLLVKKVIGPETIETKKEKDSNYV